MKLLNYLNPIAHLGEKKYSVLSPLLVMVLFCVSSEVFAYDIAKNPMIVGSYAIFIPVALIIYFAFREGIKGGLIAVVITILYYFYIMYTRHYKGAELDSGIETTIILALLDFLLAGIIGWLKQTIDQLIERESDERRRLEAIIQQLPVGVLITNKKGQLIHQNKQVEKILGRKFPANYTFGKDRTILNGTFNGKLVKPSESPLAYVITKGRAITEKEYTLEFDENRKKYVQVSASAIRNKQGKIIAAAQIIADITNQKEIEKQKDDFLSMASHELKTPITSMKMFIDLQSRQLQNIKSEKAKYFNNRIKDQANRLKELTNDLLDVSRIQTGKLRFNKEECNLTEIVKDTVEGLSGTTTTHTIQLKGASKYSILGDKYRIYQVLVNLITNAIKYSPNGKKINVEIRKIKQNVVVSIQDFGIGIRKEQQTRIFDRLYQVTDPNEKTFPGLGLGLYISKEIIEKHKGKIWVESEFGKQSTFFFSLPLVSKNK
ncbi:MAG: sensor histidine kinase [Candidatus Levyibacteriota bacterium]